MQGKTLVALTATLMGSATLTPVKVVAAAAPSLPTCSQLATLLSANSYISQTSSDNEGIASPTATIVPATSTTSAYCNVNFQFSAQSGPTYGYAVGESQTIGIVVGLPLNSADGGTPHNPSGYSWTAVNGAWNGKIENIGGGGDVGSLAGAFPVAVPTASSSGYVGSFTDGGHNSSATGNGTVGNFGVIQSTHQLDVGKLNDFADEAIHQQYVWAKWLAQKYYGTPAIRNYWNGCSTGGREALGLAEKFGYDFDGILAGAPANWYQEFWLGEGWSAMVNRDFVVGAGDNAITNAQYNNVVAHAIAACDVEGTDVVADGVIDDPRQCTYTAEGDPTVISAPGGTCTGSNCIDALQAAAIDKIWDGPRNHDGRRIWHPWFKDVLAGIAELIISPAQVPTGQIDANQAIAWDHKDLTFNPQNLYSSRTLASANPLHEPSPIALEDEFALADSAGGPENIVKSSDFQGLIDNFYTNCKNGVGSCKLIMWQGGADQFIPTQDSIETYRETATLFGHGTADIGTPQSTPGGSGLQSWFRYYHAPGVGHCGDFGGAFGIGPDPTTPLADGQPQVFDDLVNWVENGVVPQSAGDSTHIGILGTGVGSYGTRPVCPWPTTAIYNGSGSTAVASNYSCGGNLDANVSLLCQGLHTVYGEESSNSLDYAAQGVTTAQCPNP